MKLFKITTLSLGLMLTAGSLSEARADLTPECLQCLQDYNNTIKSTTETCSAAAALGGNDCLGNAIKELEDCGKKNNCS